MTLFSNVWQIRNKVPFTGFIRSVCGACNCHARLTILTSSSSSASFCGLKNAVTELKLIKSRRFDRILLAGHHSRFAAATFRQPFTPHSIPEFLSRHFKHLITASFNKTQNISCNDSGIGITYRQRRAIKVLIRAEEKISTSPHPHQTYDNKFITSQ